MEASTGKILFEKDSHTPIPPASMSKLMTVYLVMEALQTKRITKDTEFVISRNARRQIGSRMFLEEGKKVRAIDLLRGAIIQSGNDACTALAEGIAGSVSEFVKLMNQKAQKLGLKESSFGNPTGLPDPRQRMSVHDLAQLSRHIITDFPEYYTLYSEKEFTWNKIKQGNRNPLLYNFDGADGIKTGHTEEAGYGLVGSAKRSGMRLISVVSGLNSKKQRGLQSRNLLNYGFGQFYMRHIGIPQQAIANIPVHLGAVNSVRAEVKDIHKFPVKHNSFLKKEAKITLEYRTPLSAPIQKGDIIGYVTAENTGSGGVIKLPVHAMDNVAPASLWKRFTVSVGHFLGNMI